MDKFLIIGLLILIIISIYTLYHFISKSIESDISVKTKTIDILESYGILDQNGGFFEYKYNGITYYLQIIKISQNTKFTFNSKTIWEKRIGQKKLYTDQTVFSKYPGKKIVIIYPHMGPYMYHYDENEIKFTNPHEKIWDMHIIPAANLEEVLKKGL